MTRVLVPLTSAEDGSTHLVRFRLYEEGLMSGEGRYAALCGKNVLAGSMSQAPGRECPLCRAAASPAGFDEVVRGHEPRQRG